MFQALSYLGFLGTDVVQRKSTLVVVQQTEILVRLRDGDHVCIATTTPCITPHYTVHSALQVDSDIQKCQHSQLQVTLSGR